MEAAGSVQAGRKADTGFLHVLFAKLASIRLTILLCILLALVSLVGTLIPQKLAAVQYAGSYGPGAAGIIAFLGLSDVYHSAGFVFLLCFLAANLLACSAKRFPNVWRATRREHPVPADKQFKSWKYREAFVLSQVSENLENQLEGVISKAFGKKPKQKEENTHERVYCIERGRYARYGPYIAHLGILLILLGGVVGIFFGFKGTVTLPEGQEAEAAWMRDKGESIPFGFRIRCNRFVLLQYPNGAPKEYRSEVSIIDGKGATVMEGEIRVNHPLTYRGITFYQSTYGKIFETTLRVRNQQSGQETEVTVELNRPFSLPGDQPLRAMAVAFQENLQIPLEMQRRTSFPSTGLGPAVRLVMLDDKGFGRPFWVLKEFSGESRNQQGPYHFRLQAYRSTYYTGLQVARDPGASLVWAGCTLLIVGFLMALLMDHEILWVSSKREVDGRVVLCLAGRAVRHPDVYSGRFERRRSGLRRAIAPWLQQE
jgi:cytochrome c biogenesis protein